MAKRRVRLTFSREKVTEPVIYNAGQRFKVVTNIRRADVTRDVGWVLLREECETLPWQRRNRCWPC